MSSMTWGSVALVVVVAVLLESLVFCYGAEYCYVKTPSWMSQTSADKVRLSLFASIRQGKDNGCGPILPESLQHYVAVAWIVSKLNQGFIPGIKFDFELYDDCESPVYTARNAMSLLGPSLSDVVTNCTHSDPSHHLGIVGPYQSMSATEASRLLKTSNIPMISPSATVVDLSNKTLHPNLFRTALPDTLQIQLVLKILKTLDWTYVVVVYSNDMYGRKAAEMLRTQGRKTGVCFVKSLEVSEQTNRENLFQDLKAVNEKTLYASLGVVYFGFWRIAKSIMEYYSRNADTNVGLHWLMSDSVGKMYGVFENKYYMAQGTITLSPSTMEFEDLKSFWSAQSDNNKLIQQYLAQDGSDRNLMSDTQFDYISSSVDATYAYAVALKDAHDQLCQGKSGMCSALAGHLGTKGFLDRLRGVDVNYTSINETFVPKEFVQQGRQFSFSSSGDIVRKSNSVMYEINSLIVTDNEIKFSRVGKYSSEGLTFNKSAIVMTTTGSKVRGTSLPKSICRKYCAECVEFGQVPMLHLPGSVYIVGIFSIHKANKDEPFMCGPFRKVSSDTIALEAFVHTVIELRHLTGINFGAVAFDDCYSPARLTSIVSEYFTNIGRPREVFNEVVLLNKTVAVIGTLSSGSTIPLASFFNHLNIPVISYASSSPDLDDRVNFPNFLRTVPSDVEQAQAMVAIILAMDWEYVSVLYVNNNYGTKGMQQFRSLASEAGICVLDTKNISETKTSGDPSLNNVMGELSEEDVKVLVFFGIDTRFVDFVEMARKKESIKGKFVIIASEEWGNKQNILDSGDLATRGTITLKINPIQSSPFHTFESYLLRKTPTNNKANPWFEEFWQEQFHCNIPGGFNNIFDKNECSSNVLTKANMQKHMDNQRVSHVQYATYAAGIATKTAARGMCKDYPNDFPCDYYHKSEYKHRVWNNIREVKTPEPQSLSIFDGNGNGAIGFSIYNVHASEKNNNKLEYIKVGSYAGRRLQMDKAKLKFYNILGDVITVEAKCGAGKCSKCVRQSPIVHGTEVPVGLDGSFRVADIIIIVIFVVLSICIVIAIILTFKYTRNKVTGLSKEIQRYGTRDNGPVYEAVSERRVYQNPLPTPEHREAAPELPNHIHFVNGSNDNIAEVGQVNDGFRAEDSLSQRNYSGGTVTSSGEGRVLRSVSDNTSFSQGTKSGSPAHSGQIAMTELPSTALSSEAVHNRLPNGWGPMSHVSSPVQQQRPTSLAVDQNPRFDLRENGQMYNGIPQSVNHMSTRPDLQKMTESYIGSPVSSMSPASESRQYVPPASGFDSHSPQSPLTFTTSPVHDPALVQTHASQQANLDHQTALHHRAALEHQAALNHQAALEQQAAYTAFEMQRLQLIQQQNAINQQQSNPSSLESRPSQAPGAPLTYPDGYPMDRPRPRTNPQHMPQRVVTHHGSVDSLRSSGRSHRQSLPTKDSMEHIPETIQLQSVGNPDSRISRV